MKLEEKTIKAAFSIYSELYGERKNWDLGHHVEMWEWGLDAFKKNSFEDFNKVYDVLRGSWQVFRGSKNPWSAQKTYAKLQALSKSLKGVKLSNLAIDNLSEVWSCASALSEIKRNNDGPSLVAVSKFLHFWNPGLFIIVDRAVVWNYVFQHTWLRKALEKEAGQIENHLTKEILKDPDYIKCDFGYYPAIIWLGSRILNDNPSIMKHFRNLLLSEVEEAEKKISLLDHEAAAVEWLLIGLVELPPSGLYV